MSGHTRDVVSVCFSPDGTLLASGSADDTVRLWDTQTRCSAGYPLEGHGMSITSIVFSPDGNRLFTAGWGGGEICCWDVSSRKHAGNLLFGHTNGIWSLAISPDGAHIISGSSDNSIRTWNSQDFYLDVDYTFVSCGVRTPNRRPVTIPEGGWIRTTKGELLLWIPGEHRGSLCDISRLCIAREENKRSVRIVWDDICHGKDLLAIRDASQC